MAEVQLNLHPESVIFMEKSKDIFEGFASKSLEKLRSAFDEGVKNGLIGVVKDYEGTREELFADSKEVDGQIHAYFSTFPHFMAF